MKKAGFFRHPKEKVSCLWNLGASKAHPGTVTEVKLMTKLPRR